MATATRPARPRDTIRTLPAAARVFLRHGSPWLLLAASAISLVALCAHGRWSYGQLIVVVALLVAHPFTEWLIHVHVLHARPMRIAGRTIDLYQARKHRAHHADPRDLDILFIPLRGHLSIAVVATGLCSLLPTWPMRLALLTTIAVQTLVYEWVHFLIHTDYKPKTAPFRRLYAGHRLHHYRNENFWFGVSRRFADGVLHTNPAKQDVPLSATARTIIG
jgi:hypothetical protein